MIRESTADIIRRRRGMKPMDAINDGLQQPEARTVEVPVPPEFRAQEMAQPVENLGQSPEAIAEAQAALDEHEQGRPGSIPAQVGRGVTGQLSEEPEKSSVDEDEMWGAQEADRKSRLTAGLELAGRQLVGGITRTPVGQGIGVAPSRIPQAQAAAKSRSERAAEILRQKRQATMDDSTLKLQASQTEKNLRPPVVGKPPGEMSEYQRGTLEGREADRKLRAGETERKAAAAKAKAAKAAADAGLAAEGANIPFAGGMFRPRAGTKVEKQIAKEASDKASLYNAAVSGIDDLAIALGEYAKNPGAEARDAVVAKANGVGGALNVAQGQGAMSMDEKLAMAEALGINVFSPAGISAFAQSLTGGDKGQAAATITRRAKSVRSSLVEMAKGALKSKNFDYEPAASAAAPTAAKTPVKYLVSPDKKRRVPVYADGSKGPEEAVGG